MKIAVITCRAYSDAWQPFTQLFYKFWPDCPYELGIYHDRPGETWCSVIARTALDSSEELLILQEDFFLTAPTQQSLVEHGLKLLNETGAGCVRLYPCPGGIKEFGDPYFAIVPRGTRFRISCQAGIWNKDFLYRVACGSMSTTGEAGDFENLGSLFADELQPEVLAFKREITPWPVQYLASAITRGQWNPDAIRLCEEHGIPLDRSQRSVAREAISRRR